jgi:hypothetical protein
MSPLRSSQNTATNVYIIYIYKCPPKCRYKAKSANAHSIRRHSDDDGSGLIYVGVVTEFVYL